jgi:hypothetical protein
VCVLPSDTAHRSKPLGKWPVSISWVHGHYDVDPGFPRVSRGREGEDGVLPGTGFQSSPSARMATGRRHAPHICAPGEGGEGTGPARDIKMQTAQARGRALFLLIGPCWLSGVGGRTDVLSPSSQSSKLLVLLCD